MFRKSGPVSFLCRADRFHIKTLFTYLVFKFSDSHVIKLLNDAQRKPLSTLFQPKPYRETSTLNIHTLLDFIMTQRRYIRPIRYRYTPGQAACLTVTSHMFSLIRWDPSAFINNRTHHLMLWGMALSIT